LELFWKQDAAYREQVLPRAVTARVSIEAGVTFGWERFVGDRGVAIGVDRYGASAPDKKLYQEFGLTAANVVATAKRVLASP
jgi:transketolase